MSKLISLVVPVFNEEENLPEICAQVEQVLSSTSYELEIILVDDGSVDGSVAQMKALAEQNPKIRVLEFSRNFGKEIATTAGICSAAGDAVIIIDADLQHPPCEIKEFLRRWENGAEVVIGVRRQNKSDGIIKKFGSWVYYKIINSISETKSVPQATDFRLLDRGVVNEFCRLSEHTRIMRGLIDWLGFRREYVYFDAKERKSGQAKYSLAKLYRLAITGFVSMSFAPLKLAGYLGGAIIIISILGGAFVLWSKYIAHDPFQLHFSGLALLSFIILFLVGVILVCMGLMALYIAHIQTEVNNRPIYILRRPRGEHTSGCGCQTYKKE